MEQMNLKTQKMKAAISTKYGGPNILEVHVVEKPMPKDNEILVKIVSSSVTTADTMMRTGKPYIGRLFIGLLKPSNPIPGTGFAGIIESIGSDVANFKVGDQVFGESLFGSGTNAEYVCIPTIGILSIMPEGLSYEEAAVICDGAVTSMNFLLNLGQIRTGQKILINGASGSLGTAAVQIAKYYGAEVTGVCSGSNEKLVTSLGADHVINYTQDDFTSMDEKYDIIYDTVGKSSFSKCKKVLKKEGVYLSPVLGMGLLLNVIMTSIRGKKKAKFSATGTLKPTELIALLEEAKNIIIKGQLYSVIDKVYSLINIVQAHQYIDKGHKVGNVVINN